MEKDHKTTENPLLWRFLYVDDTHMEHKKAHTVNFIEHLNSIGKDIEHVKWTNEATLAFLDANIIRVVGILFEPKEQNEE